MNLSRQNPAEETELSKREAVQKFDQVVQRAVEKILTKHPRVLGIIVDGSVGRRNPSPYSDVDLMVITRPGKKPEQFWYFDEHIYVGVGFHTLKEYGRETEDPKEFFWARGGALSARVLYDPKLVIGKVLKARRRAKATREIVEDNLGEAYHNIIEYVGKLRNGWFSKDELLTRYAARVIARYCEQAVIVLNDLSPISENYVWHQVLGAKKKPINFREDYPTAQGIKGTAQTSRVFHSGLRLGVQTLELIRQEFRDKARKATFRAMLQQSVPIMKGW